MSSLHSVTASAPGKTNLFFAVGPLLTDGFHDVASIYLALNLREEVTVSPSEAWSVSISGNVSPDQISSVPTDESNLVVRAAKLVASMANVEARPLKFQIDKHVPVAGGMGGGSADAAAAMIAAEELWSDVVESDLAQSVELGADVPFALAGGIAVGLGRGEQLSAIPDVPQLNLVLVLSDQGLSTPAVYQRLDELRAARGLDPRDAPAASVPEDLIAALKSGDLEKIATLLKNDLQEAALDLRPDLNSTLEAGLAAGALAGWVSGSGPTIAFLTADANNAEELTQKLSAQGFTALATAGPDRGAFIREEI